MKNAKTMVTTLVELQKQGIKLYLTDAGWNMFLKQMSELNPADPTDAAVQS